MRDHERLNRPVIVSLPAEIDIASAEDVGEQLRAAFAPGVTVVGAIHVSGPASVAERDRSWSWVQLAWTGPSPAQGSELGKSGQLNTPIEDNDLCRPSGNSAPDQTRIR